MSIKVGILMGGNSQERLISLSTAKAVTNACISLGYSVTHLSFENNYIKFLDKMKRLDIVFNALHGGMGENGEIQSWMDENRIKYTGSGPLASALCMDKEKSKILVKENNIETPSWQLITDIKDDIIIDLPFVVKPNEQGSTFGLSVVKKQKEITSAIEMAFKYGKNILIEEYIQGRELTVPVVGDEVYPIVEIQPSHFLYDYYCKYTPGMTKYICPAILDTHLEKKIYNNAKLLFDKFNCSVYGRLDFILDTKESVPYFLEMNTLPGMTATSLVPKSATAMGIKFKKLIETIIKLSI